MILPETLPPDVDLAELRIELARERRAYNLSLRARHDDRVCDEGVWEATLLRRRLRIAALEREERDLRERLLAA